MLTAYDILGGSRVVSAHLCDYGVIIEMDDNVSVLQLPSPESVAPIPGVRYQLDHSTQGAHVNTFVVGDQFVSVKEDGIVVVDVRAGNQRTIGITDWVLDSGTKW